MAMSLKRLSRVLARIPLFYIYPPVNTIWEIVYFHNELKAFHSGGIYFKMEPYSNNFCLA